MSHDPSCLRVFAIPELVDHVQRYLLCQDLAHCTRVCKVFLQAFTPPLWHTVSIRSQRQHKVFTTSPEIQEALNRNCKHIRVIRLQSCKSLSPFLETENAALQQLRVHTLEFPWPESIPHKCMVSRKGDPVPEQEECLRSIQEGLDFESILEQNGPRDPELCARTQCLAEGHPKDWLQTPGVFLMRHQLQDCNIRLHRYLRARHFESEQYLLDAQTWIKNYPLGVHSSNAGCLPPPPPLLPKDLQFVLRITAYSIWTHSCDMHLRKRAMILLILQVNSLQIYQQHLKVASASNAEFSFQQVQRLILTDAEDYLVTATPAAEHLDVQRETQRQLQLEMQSLRNDGLFQAPAELHAQRWFQLHQQLHLMLHEQIILLYDNEQNFHVLQKSIRLQQQQCQEGSHWQSRALTGLPQELMEWLRELLQELSLAPTEDELKGLANDFESQAKTRSKNKDEYLEIYTAKISQIQGWTASLKTQRQCAQLLPQSSFPLDAQQDIHNPPPSPTFIHLIPRFIDSYRPATANPSNSEIPWDKDEADDEQLLIQFLGRLPNGSLRVFSSNKFSFRSRALLELLTSSATQLQGLTCLSMYRNDASEVNTQLMATDWYEEESLVVDPFTAEMDWFLHRCPLQLHTLRIAIAGSLEPMHHRLFEQRSRAARYGTRTQLKATSTAMKHLYLEGDLAMGGQAGFLERCPDLRSLGLSCTKHYPLFLLEPMIVHCPKIEDLAISCPSRSGDDMTNALSAVIRGCAPTSTSTSSSVSMTSSTTAVIQRKGLKRLRLENLQASQDAVIEALLLCAPTLTHLAIRDCQTPMTFEQQTGTETFESTISFNRVLETFTQLQELDLMRTPKFTLPKPTRAPRHVMLHGKLDAQHLVELKPLARSNGDINKAWACSSTLKVLRIEINGIHRAPPSRVKVPDAHTALATTNSSSSGPASLPTTAAAAAAAQEGLEGPDPEQIKEGYRLQREVCLLLGTLLSLEELCLGTLNVPGDDSPPALPGLSQWRGGSYIMAAGIQTQCLELALSTGLELMSEMKEMRVLKVGGLEHRIGLGEIQWMCEHWPKLKAVYGLLRVKNREQYDPDWEGKEEDKEMETELVEWIRKNRPHLRYT